MAQANLQFRGHARQLIASGHLVQESDDSFGSGLVYYRRNWKNRTGTLSAELTQRLKHDFDFAIHPSPCALALAGFIRANPAGVLGRRVVEIAAGSGVTAIAAAQAGAKEVVTIDPSGGEIVELNAEINNVIGQVRIHPDVYQSKSSQAYIKGADVIFMSRLYSPYGARERNEHVQDVLRQEWQRGASVFISALSDCFDEGWDQLHREGRNIHLPTISEETKESSSWLMFQLSPSRQ